MTPIEMSDRARIAGPSKLDIHNREPWQQREAGASLLQTELHRCVTPKVALQYAFWKEFRLLCDPIEVATTQRLRRVSPRTARFPAVASRRGADPPHMLVTTLSSQIRYMLLRARDVRRVDPRAWPGICISIQEFQAALAI